MVVAPVGATVSGERLALAVALAVGDRWHISFIRTIQTSDGRAVVGTAPGIARFYDHYFGSKTDVADAGAGLQSCSIQMGVNQVS